MMKIKPMYVVEFPDDDTFTLAWNAVLHMSKWAQIEANREHNSPYSESMQARADQYMRVFRIFDKTKPCDESES